MPAIDNPYSVAASIPGQIRDLQRQLKDLSVNRTFSPAGFHIGLTGLVVDGPTTLTGGITGNVSIGGTLGTGGTITSGGNVNAGAGFGFGVGSTGKGFDGSGNMVAASATVSGNSVVSGTSTSTGVVISPGSRAFNMVSGYAGAWLNSDGTLGISTSSVEYKQDVEPADMAEIVDALLRVALVRFRYIESVEKLGDAAPVELGSIAEYLETSALREYVFHDEDGRTQGITYERLTIPLIATAQSQAARIKTLEGQVDDLSARVAALGG